MTDEAAPSKVYNFSTFSSRDEINIRVLKRIVSERIENIELVVPQASVYRATGDSWERLQISGPLFLLRLVENPDPFIFVMNSTCFVNTENFTMKIVIQSTQMKVIDNKLYFRSEDGSVAIGAGDATLIRQLHQAIQTFGQHQVKEPEVADCVKQDPTYRHMMRVLGLQ